jgi:hypothetical protein
MLVCISNVSQLTLNSQPCHSHSRFWHHGIRRSNPSTIFAGKGRKRTDVGLISSHSVFTDLGDVGTKSSNHMVYSSLGPDQCDHTFCVFYPLVQERQTYVTVQTPAKFDTY